MRRQASGAQPCCHFSSGTAEGCLATGDVRPQVEVLFEVPGCTNACSARPAPCSFRGPVDSFNLWIWVQLYRPPTGTDLEMLQASGCAAAQAVSVLLLKKLGHVLLLTQLGCRCCRQVGVLLCEQWLPPTSLPSCPNHVSPATHAVSTKKPPVAGTTHLSPATPTCHLPAGGAQLLVPAGPPGRLQLWKPAGVLDWASARSASGLWAAPARALQRPSQHACGLPHCPSTLTNDLPTVCCHNVQVLYHQEEGLEELEYDNDDEGAQVRCGMAARTCVAALPTHTCHQRGLA